MTNKNLLSFSNYRKTKAKNVSKQKAKVLYIEYLEKNTKGILIERRRFTRV
jgi:hypothetical protein